MFQTMFPIYFEGLHFGVLESRASDLGPALKRLVVYTMGIYFGGLESRATDYLVSGPELT